LLEFVAFAAIGKILIYLWQQFPLTEYLSSKWKPLSKLFGCDLCFGVWVYWFMACFFTNVNPFINIIDKFSGDMPLFLFAFVFTAFLTGAVTSFIVYIFSLGCNAKFQIIVVE